MTWTAYRDALGAAAPDLLAGLADPPAPFAGQQLALLGEMPPDVAALLTNHDGTRVGHRLLYSLVLMRPAHIAKTVQRTRRFPPRREAQTPEMDPRVQALTPHPGLVPVFTDDTGNFLGYDTAPTARGTWGQVVVFGADIETPEVVAPSFAALFQRLADELRAGAFIRVPPRGQDAAYLLPRDRETHPLRELLLPPGEA